MPRPVPRVPTIALLTAMRRRASLPTALAALSLPAAALAVPATVPVQGVLQDADGAPIAAELPVVFTLYADADGSAAVWLEERDVAFDRGFFTLELGAVEPLDAGLFRDHPEGLWLGIAVDGDEQMPPIAIGTAPFAGLAAYAGQAATADDAAAVGGLSADEFARVDHRHPFAELDAIPPGLADGDDDTTYIAGDGLRLDDRAFALQPCAEGQVLATAAAGWVCADGDVFSPAVGVELAGTELIVTDGAAVTVVDLAALVADADADPANELLIGAALDGSTLVLDDAGGRTRVDLAALIPDAALTVSAAALDGSTLVLGRGADPADALTVDLAPLLPVDGDRDPANELLRGAALDDTTLELSDAGGVVRVDLAPLVAEDGDRDPQNERLLGAALDGTTLELSDVGGITTVDLAPLVAGGDDDPANELLRAARLNGGVLELDDAGGPTTVDLSSLGDDADADPTNELLAGATLDGTILTLEDAGGARAVELAALVDDADADPTNELLTGAALDGTALTLDEAGVRRQVELAALVDDADADPTNELQSLVFSGRTGVLSMTGTNAVDVYEGAYVLSSTLRGPAAPEPVGGIVGDDIGQSVELPFSVRYSGVDYTHVWLESNGFFEFQTEAANLGSDFFNTGLPSVDHAGPFVAAYWDDLTSSVSWSTAGGDSGRVFTINWNGQTLFRGHTVRFTAQIHEGSGAIAVRYRSMAAEASGQSATIGFQTAGAGNAKAYTLGVNAAVIDSDDPNGQGWSITPLR